MTPIIAPLAPYRSTTDTVRAMRRHAVSAPAPRDCAVSRLPSLDGMRAHGRSAAFHYLYLRHVDHAGAQQRDADGVGRSEEHTSELQSQSNLVCRLLLEKKKTHNDRAD